MIKFTSDYELIDYLRKMNFRSYNLEEALQKFIKNYLESIGSTAENDIKNWQSFEWITEENQKIKIDIAIQHTEVDEDTYAYNYYVV